MKSRTASSTIFSCERILRDERRSRVEESSRSKASVPRGSLESRSLASAVERLDRLAAAPPYGGNSSAQFRENRSKCLDARTCFPNHADLGSASCERMEVVEWTVVHPPEPVVHVLPNPNSSSGHSRRSARIKHLRIDVIGSGVFSTSTSGSSSSLLLTSQCTPGPSRKPTGTVKLARSEIAAAGSPSRQVGAVEPGLPHRSCPRATLSSPAA